MRVTIRVDDLGWTPQESACPPVKLRDVGFALARRFHEAMGGLPYLGGIIPICVDAEAGLWLRSNPEGLTPALHGWDHSSPHGVANEFHYDSLEETRDRLERGQKRLGAPTEHLIPPFNAATAELIEACPLEGVQYIWGGASHTDKAPSIWSSCPPPYPVGTIMFVPSWAPLYGASLWKMNEHSEPLVDILPRFIQRPGLAVLTLHVPWEAAHENASFNGLRQLVDLIHDHVISPEEYLSCANAAS